MAKTINNWCPQGIVHSVQMDCSFRRNDGKNDNRSNRNGTTLLALDCELIGGSSDCLNEKMIWNTVYSEMLFLQNELVGGSSECLIEKMIWYIVYSGMIFLQYEFLGVSSNFPI